MKRTVTILFVVLISFAYGQDVHFSQFYNAPLALNPALTGKVDGVFRFAFNYRNQWFSLAGSESPFVTYAGSFDMPILFRKDALGVGLVIVNDQTGEGRLNSTAIMASVAYHKALDKANKHSLSLGVQGGYIQKRLDLNELRFFNQFNTTTQAFEIGMEDGESLEESRGNFDLQVGMIANSRFAKKVSSYVGFSIFHLMAPDESFTMDGSEELSRRFVVHGGVEWYFSKRAALLPSVIYMSQRKTDELNLGTAVVFNMEGNAKTLFYIGGYYRLLPNSKSNDGNISDAAIAYTAFEFKNLRLGFSFDATTSSLKHAPKTAGSFELSLIYVHPVTLPDVKSLLFCPRF